jgi:hypothetical protein
MEFGLPGQSIVDQNNTIVHKNIRNHTIFLFRDSVGLCFTFGFRMFLLIRA